MLLLLSSFIFKNIKRLQYFLPDGQKSKDLKSERKKRIFIKKKKNLSFRMSTLPSLPPHAEVLIPLSEICDFKRVRKIRIIITMKK